MLNTKSCWTTAIIWVAIAAIFGSVLWHAIGWPTPGVAWTAFLKSESAETMKQFQILLAGIIGFGLASLAYLLNNGWERTTKLRAATARSRSLALAMIHEAERHETGCDAAAAHFSQLAAEAESKGGSESIMLSGKDRMVLRRCRAGGQLLTSLDANELTGFGSNACSAVLGLRNAIIDLDRTARGLTRQSAGPDADDLKEIARLCASISLQCQRVRPLLWTLTRHGSEVADERELVAAPSAAEIERHLRSIGGGASPAPSATVIAGPGANPIPAMR